MSKDFDLSSQIGEAGGEVGEYTEDGVHTLGHMEHVGKQKQELTPEEEESKAAFLERTNKRSSIFGARANSEILEDSSVVNGWIPIDREEMGIRSLFYPEDWEFRVKPATVEAIKNWSSIDETNFAVTNNVFNEIMKACVSIVTPAGKLPWNKINSWDRFWFILKVREYTFVNGEAALNYDEDCTECGAQVFFDLKPENLVYEFPDRDVVDKHWIQEKRVWQIDPAEYDVDAPVQTLYTPTLEKDDAIFQWAYLQAQNGRTPSEPLLRFLPWLIAKVSKDPQQFERTIKEARQTFNSWDEEMFSFMDEVRRNITINPSEKLKQVCPNCGEEVIASVRFPNGIKSLFAIQSKHRKFGSK